MPRALPVLIHPTAPPGVQAMQMNEFQLTASIGFTFDTTLAVSRMLYDGFFDRYIRLKIIASHGGGALPYPDRPPGPVLSQHPRLPHQDASPAVELHGTPVSPTRWCSRSRRSTCASRSFGDDQVLFGSDYPHTIGDPVGCLAKVNSLLGARREKVRGGNAQRIFKF